MSDLSSLWKKLCSSKEYREALVAAQLKRGLPFQARAMRKERGWSQAVVAEKSKLTQGAVSRAEDPDYGNLTFNTVLRVAAGHDVAVICKFVSFSDFARWYVKFSEGSGIVPIFAEERDSVSAELQNLHVPVQLAQNNRTQLQQPWSSEVSGNRQEKKPSSSEHNTFFPQGELAYAASVGGVS